MFGVIITKGHSTPQYPTAPHSTPINGARKAISLGNQGVNLVEMNADVSLGQAEIRLECTGICEKKRERRDENDEKTRKFCMGH